MALLCQITHKARIQDVQFVDVAEVGEVLLVAGEDKKVSVYKAPTDLETATDEETSQSPYKLVAEFVGHDSR